MAKAPAKKSPTVAAKKAAPAAPKATFGGLNNSYEPKIPVTRQTPRDPSLAKGPGPQIGVRNPIPGNSSSFGRVPPLRGLKRNKPAVEDPALPPTDGSVGGATTPTTPTTPVSPPPTAPVPKEWSAIVNHYFPNGGTGYKAGGLVRGCGAATKGGGRGKIV